METITVTQIRDDVNLDQHNNGDGKTEQSPEIFKQIKLR